MFGDLFQFFLGLMIIFFWITALIVWFQCVTDLFRRDDLTGAFKIVWFLVLVFIPWLGAIAYMVTRPKVTATDVKGIVRAEAAVKAMSNVSVADELAKLSQLKEQGVISEAEYTSLKARIVA